MISISLVGILHQVHHSRVLLLGALVCLPVLMPLASFFFDDFESFRRDLGIDDNVNRYSWIFGRPTLERGLGYRIAGFVGSYIVLVSMTYCALVDLGLRFHWLAA